MSLFVLRIFAVSALLTGLAGCGATEKEAPPPASRPVKVFVVQGGEADAVRTFPGRVDATKRAELAFRVAGQLQEILVREGDLVEEGQVLARLDPTDVMHAGAELVALEGERVRPAAGDLMLLADQHLQPGPGQGHGG